MATNVWALTDQLNAADCWFNTRSWVNRKIIVYKFNTWETQGNESNPNETFRTAKYDMRYDTVWVSQVKVYDTVKGGYFTTGDLNVASSFILQGNTPTYTLPNGVVIPEYAGDEIIWNGKIWVVADQLDPIQFGTKVKHVWYNSVLRRTGRSGTGITSGPT